MATSSDQQRPAATSSDQLRPAATSCDQLWPIGRCAFNPHMTKYAQGGVIQSPSFDQARLTPLYFLTNQENGTTMERKKTRHTFRRYRHTGNSNKEDIIITCIRKCLQDGRVNWRQVNDELNKIEMFKGVTFTTESLRGLFYRVQKRKNLDATRLKSSDHDATRSQWQDPNATQNQAISGLSAVLSTIPIVNT